MVRVLMAIMLVTSVNCFAAIDAYPFPDEQLQQRYNGLIDALRCPQCLNTNLAGSDAMVAKDLRREVHRLVLEGKSDSEVREFMLARYGDFILYDPQLKKETILLWFGPLFLFLIALIAIYRVTRKRGQKNLSPEEQTRLNQLIDSVDL